MKRFRIQLLIAGIVFICGVSLMGLIYILFNKPFVAYVPNVTVSSPSPVAMPHMPYRSNYPRRVEGTSVRTKSDIHVENHMMMPSVSPYLVVQLSDAHISNIGNGFGGSTGVASSSGSRRSSHSSATASVAMPMTTFVAIASTRQVAEPEAANAPAMAKTATAPLTAPGPPNPGGPLSPDDQLIEHLAPIGDAMLPMLLLVAVYCATRVYRRRGVKSEGMREINDPHRCGSFILEAVGGSEQEIDALRAVTVIDFVLAMQPVVKLEE